MTATRTSTKFFRWIFILGAAALLATCNLSIFDGEADRDTDNAAVNGQGEGAMNSQGQTSDAEPAQPLSPQARWLDDRVFELGTAFPGYVGIAVYDIDRSEKVHFNGNEMFPQQSVSKLWVALTALDMADSSILDLDEQGTVRYENLTVFHQPIRKKVLATGRFTTTYRDYMRRALTASDNTANDMVLSRVGGPKVVRLMLERKGITNVRFGPGERKMQSQIAALEWDQRYSVGKSFFTARANVPHDLRKIAFDAYVTDPIDGASPNAMAGSLARLAQGELLSDEKTQLFLGWLNDVKSGPNRLKGGVPAGWSIGHKTGTGQVLDIVPPGVIGEQAGYNDVGIVTAPDGSRYAIAVMLGRTRRPVPERMDLMHAVVGAVVQYHGLANGGAEADGAGAGGTVRE